MTGPLITDPSGQFVVAHEGGNFIFTPAEIVNIMNQDSVSPLSDASRKMMLCMLEMGLNPAVISVLLELAAFHARHVRYLAGPVIVAQGVWADTLPRWLIPAIYRQRLEQILAEHAKGEVGELATLIEVLAYLYPHSMQYLLSREWQQIYLWCGQETLPKYGQTPAGTQLWQILDSDRPLLLSDYERRYVMAPLQGKIRRAASTAARRQGVAKRSKLPNQPLLQSNKVRRERNHIRPSYR